MTLKKIKTICIFLLFLFFISFCYSLTTITVTEGDLVKLETTAQDPDQDNVSLYYSPPLDESGEWQTTLDDAGTYHTTVIASDGISETEEEVVIVVNNKNRAPEIEDKKIVVEETEIIDLKELISDPDEEDTLKLIFGEPFDEEGVWQTTYGDAGTYQTEIIASDLEDKVSRVIEVEVVNKNRLPKIISSFSESEAVQLTEDSTFEFSVSAQDEDGDTLSYSWQLGGREISQESLFEHYFDFDSAGEYELILVVSDQESEMEDIWTLTVEDCNRPPEIEIPDIIVNEGEKIMLQLPETDADGDVITYTFQPPFEEGVWQTTYDNAGNHTALITAFDGDLTVENGVNIIINEVDRSPVINLEEKVIINENEELKIDLNEFVSDPDGDELVINVENLPAGAVFSDNVLNWQPGFDFVQRKSSFFTDVLNKLRLEKYLLFQSKDVNLLITACGKELCTGHALVVEVKNTNQKPLLEEMKDMTLTETETLLLEPSAVDADGDFIRYEFGEPFDSDGEWQTTLDDAGTYTVTVTASDGRLTDIKELEVVVLNKNRPPTLEIEDYLELNEGEPLSLKINVADPDEDNLTVWAENLPEGASFKDQVFFWTPSIEGIDYEQFTVNFIASDEEFDVVHPVTFVVKNINHVPEIVEHSPKGDLVVEMDEPIVFSVTAEDMDGDDLMYEWDFGFWDMAVKGPSAIQRTFKTPGRKTIKVEVSDGKDSVELEWKVRVKALPVLGEVEEEDVLVPPQLEETEEEQPSVEEESEQEMPEVICPEQEPCLPTPPLKPPFKVYVIES